MAAQVRGLGRHHDDVSNAARDVLLASRAEVDLGRLKGVDVANFDLLVAHCHHRGIRAHRSIAATTAAAAATMR